MIVTTGNEIAGHGIDRYLGIVRGIVVRSPNYGVTALAAGCAGSRGRPERSTSSALGSTGLTR